MQSHYDLAQAKKLLILMMFRLCTGKSVIRIKTTRKDTKLYYHSV